MNREVIIQGVFSIQVCVPKTDTDEQVMDFANRVNPTGINSGWTIRREGDPVSQGDPERQQCSQYEENCHIVLDC
jgi:hypothetical protein